MRPDYRVSCRGLELSWMSHLLSKDFLAIGLRHLSCQQGRPGFESCQGQCKIVCMIHTNVRPRKVLDMYRLAMMAAAFVLAVSSTTLAFAETITFGVQALTDEPVNQTTELDRPRGDGSFPTWSCCMVVVGHGNDGATAGQGGWSNGAMSSCSRTVSARGTIPRASVICHTLLDPCAG